MPTYKYVHARTLASSDPLPVTASNQRSDGALAQRYMELHPNQTDIGVGNGITVASQRGGHGGAGIRAGIYSSARVTRMSEVL